MYFVFSVIILEILLRFTTGNSRLFSGDFSAAQLCVAFICLAVVLLAALIKSDRSRKAVLIALLEIITIWFIISFFTFDAYKVFMSPEIIAQEAGNVATVFGDKVLVVLTKGLGIILLYHLPLAVYVASSRYLPDLPVKWLCILSALLMILSACFTPGILRKMAGYTYDDDVKRFGLIPTLARNISKSAYEQKYEISTPVPVEETPDEKVIDAPVTPEPAIEYGYNVMNLDFEGMSGNNHGQFDELNEYVKSLTPSRKNSYTGMFAGKNLILITAEAFTKEVIDEQRTPTLYRLANEGIVFEDFYQPAWGGSTSTGEYSFLTGLVPTEATSMQGVIHNNMYFTMGNQLQRQNYTSIAYHDGQYDYYERNNTHTHLGYKYFIAYGSGLVGRENGGNELSSDLGLMIATVPEYIDRQPFSIYYMTISGHCNYAFYSDTNKMAVKNRAITEGMPYSEPVRAYYACNQELENALKYLVDKLEEEGIADDTVIALVSDHYPYGLEPSTTWENNVDYLSELYGFPADTNPKRDHNAAIIWCGSLEGDSPVVVSEPVSSLDILPTLSNLFGLEYDSRLLVGRDVFSDAQPLVFWNDFSWLTDKGYYDGYVFYPSGDEHVDEEYIGGISSIVRNKRQFSEQVMDMNYYNYLFGDDDIE